jgi:hypothetical protein
MRPLSSPHTRMTASGGRLSAMGHEQTWRHVRVTSAVPLKADIHQSGLHVRFVPGADILAAESHCSVPAETCESNVRFGINSLVTSAVGRTGGSGLLKKP